MAAHDVYLCIGGNLGDRMSNLEETRLFIEFNMGDLTGLSPIVESEAWGMTDAPAFLNQVVRISTELSPTELLGEVRELEAYFGRKRKSGEYVSREMDVDILSYDDLVLSTDELEIPHSRLAERRFVLAPLAALNPEWPHPSSGKRAAELLASCTDPLEVKWHG